MATQVRFSRLVFGLHPSAFSAAGIARAMEFATLLDLDLHGLFVEDPSLVDAAQYAGTREFQVLQGRWQPIELQTMVVALERAALQARRRLSDAARVRRVSSHFEIVRCPVEEAVAKLSHRHDILVIAEPRDPAERRLGPFPQLLKSIAHATSAVLLLPRRHAPAHGPIKVLASQPHDRCVAVARALATTANARLLVEAAAAGDDLAAAMAALTGTERLVVAPRPRESADGQAWLDAVASRRVPLLLVPEPGDETA